MTTAVLAHQSIATADFPSVVIERALVTRRRPDSPVQRPAGWESPIPDEMTELGAGLLDQQFWCWGCDIRFAPINLLLEYGFTRYRSSDRARPGPVYALDCAPGAHVALWGGGLFFGLAGDGGLLLSRFDFIPQLLASDHTPSATWRVDQLGPKRLPCGANDRVQLGALLPCALQWIGDYESWVQRVAGMEYRRQCVAAWPRAVLPARQVAATWHSFADELAGLLGVESGSEPIAGSPMA